MRFLAKSTRRDIFTILKFVQSEHNTTFRSCAIRARRYGVRKLHPLTESQTKRGPSRFITTSVHFYIGDYHPVFSSLEYQEMQNEEGASDGVSSWAGDRSVLDRITLSVMGFLQQHRGVTDVKWLERSPAVEEDLNEWEQKHSPYLLPQDMRAFYLISDGLLLKWQMRYQGEWD